MRGLLVLEDLKDQNRSGGPLISLNKDEITDVKTGIFREKMVILITLLAPKIQLNYSCHSA